MHAKSLCPSHLSRLNRYGTLEPRPMGAPRKAEFVGKCPGCGKETVRATDWRGYHCSDECLKKSRADKRGARWKRTVEATRSRLENAPDKRCQGCKVTRPAVEFLGTYGRENKTCSHCRGLAAGYGTAESRFAGTLRLNYGITLEQYEAMVTEQDNCCAICREPESLVRSGSVARLSIDHCHESGQVRGLLCSRCNHGIGNLRESVDLLNRAATYLQKHKRK